MKRLLDLAGAPTLPDFDAQSEAALTRSRRVYVESFGCQMNVSDTEIIRSLLVDAGNVCVDEPEAADAVLLNTCAVRDHAEERVFGRLAELQRLRGTNPDVIFGVCGCMAQHLKERIVERAPHVDLVIGPDAYRQLPEALDRAAEEPQFRVRLDHAESYDGVDPIHDGGIRAWLTIQRGCDKFCTFCIVPFVRGRERSVPLGRLVSQAEQLAGKGVKEITLLGQTVNSYHDGERDFAALLEAVADVPGIERMRFTSPHPSDATDAMIRAMGAHPRVCSHVHLPLQSGSDDVLARMRRSYTVEEYLRIVDALRTHVPNVAITTDIIVGFPGETDEDFDATCRILESVRYDNAFLFQYSPREGTTAHRKLADDVPAEAKASRLRHVIELQESVSLDIYRSRVGTRQTVLVEGPSRRDPAHYFGKTDDFKTCVFPRGASEPGDLVDVIVESASAHTLLARQA